MGKLFERLESYKKQMREYAKQHQMILANDVFDILEQLQDDLKEDTENVIDELEKTSVEVHTYSLDRGNVATKKLISLETAINTIKERWNK